MTFLMPDSWYHPPEPHECDDDGCDGGLCEENAALTFEEITWACPNCGWTSALCTEHRAMAEEIRAEQDADHYRDEGDW